MAEVEALADAMTGGLAARAVEPDAGEGRHARQGACLNCDTRLLGEHCHACGQKAHVHRTLTAFGHDLLHGVLHFEGKIWRTLPMLAWRPGELTRRYVEGERARFVSPLALFLFCVFLMFAVIGWTGGPFGGAGDMVKVDGGGLDQGIVKATREVSALERRRAEAVAAGSATVSLDAELKEAREGLSTLRTIKQGGLTEMAFTQAPEDIGDAPDWIKRAYKKAKANPSLLLYKLQNNAYKYSWALIPISLPFMWLLFPFSRRLRMYDHAVFVTYSLCFMTLLAVTASVINALGGSGLVGLLTLIPPVHMYRQLRGAYRLSRIGALLRMALLLMFSTVAAIMFVLMLVALGLLG